MKKKKVNINKNGVALGSGGAQLLTRAPRPSTAWAGF